MNLAVEPHLARHVHDTDATSAEFAVERIAADDSLLECDEQCIRGLARS